MSDEDNKDQGEEPAKEEEAPATEEDESSDEPDELLGMSDAELEVYSLILAYGNATIGDIVLLSKGKSLDQIESVVGSLKAKKMIIELPGLVTRFHATPPFEGLAKEVGQVSERIQAMRDELKDQIRTAATTVRDALVAMTRENLASVASQKKDSQSRRNESIAAVQSKTNTWSTLKDAAGQKYDEASTQVISEWINNASATIDSSSQSVKSVVSETSGKLKDSVNSALTKSNELANTLRADLISSASSLESTTKQQLEAQSIAVESLLQQQAESAREKIGREENNIASSLSSSDEAITSMMASASDEIADAIKAEHLQFAEAMKSTASALAEEYVTLENDIHNSLDGKDSEETQLLQEYSGAADQSFSSMKTKHDAALGSLKSGIDQELTELSSSAGASVQAIHDKLNELEAKTNSFVDTTMDTMKTTAGSSVQGFHDNLSQYSTDVAADTHSLINIRKEEIRKSLEGMLASIQGSVSQEIASISKSLDELAVKIDTSHQGMVTTMASSMEQTKADLESKLSGISQATSAAITQISGDSKAATSELADSLQSAIGQSKAGVEASTLEFSRSAASLANELHEASSSLVEKMGAQTKQMNALLKDEASSIASNGKAHVAEESSSALNVLEQKLGDSSSRLASEIATSRSTSSEALATAKQNIQTSISALKDEFAGALDEVREGSTSALNAAISNLNAHRTESQSKISMNVDSLVSGLESRLGAGKSELDTIVTDSSSLIENNKTGLIQSMTTAGDDLRSKARAVLVNNLESSGTELDAVASETSQEIQNSYGKLDSQLDTLNGVLAKTVDKLEESSMIGLTDETLEQAFAPSGRDQVDTKHIAERLGNVWERVKATDFPGAKKTWNVVTRAAVNAHIQDMLTRAKSKVTLIVPEVQDVPVDVLADLKTTIGVELVITEGGQIGQSVRPLVGRGNIRVRTRSERDVFACVRDSEEVIMAPAASADSDVIGVVSEDDGFVRFVMSIVGPIFQAKTKLLKPEDL